jgi:hypothetical protein
MAGLANEDQVVIAKLISVAVLLYLLYIMASCPCRPELYKCHLTNIYVSIAILLAVLLYFNGLRFTSYH